MRPLLLAISTIVVGIFSTPLYSVERHFDIAAGAAAPAVKQFVKQAHMSVIYAADSLAGFKTRAIKGDYEPLDALKLLLEGSGLESTAMSSGFLSVGPVPEPLELSSEDLPIVEISGHAVLDSLGLPSNDRVTTITAAELAAQGFTTVAEWAQTLTQNQGTGAREATSYLREAPTNVGFGSGLNLYGIGQRATLILVNGRRLAPSGSAGSFTDVLNLPISAIDHIDVISDGASTIYGGDAVGGIVNFVLRDAYSKPVTVVSLGTPLSGNYVSQSLTLARDDWRGILALEYYDRSGLPAADRKQASSDETPWGGSNFDTPFGNPPSIMDRDNRYWAIPVGQNGVSLTAADLLPGLNLYDSHAQTWILPRQRRMTMFASGSADWSDELMLFADGLLSRRQIETHLPPSTAFLSVPSTNPFYVNPVLGSTEPILTLYGFGNDFGPITERGTVDSGQLTAGFKYSLNGSWDIQLSGGYAFDNQHEVQNNVADIDQLGKYLVSTDPSMAFNPFGDGSSNPPATLAAIRADATAHYLSELTTVNVEFSGSLSKTRLRTGYEFRRQAFFSSVSPNFSFTGQPLDMNRYRTLNAWYLEDSAPVAHGVSYDLNLSGGVRYERFSDPDAALLPSVGFSFDLNSGVALTGNWTSLFRPPNLPDLNESLNYSAVYPLPDPNSSTGYTSALVWGGNNAHLSPETARRWSLGLKYENPADPTVSLDLQYFNISSFHQVLTTPLLPTSVFSDPQYRYLVTRDVTPSMRDDICGSTRFFGSPDQCRSDANGAVVDLRLRSLGTVKTDGVDLKARSVRDTSLGQLSLNLQATYVLHFDEALTPGGPIQSFRNTPHNPTALRLRCVFSWEGRGLTVSPAINFEGSYTDTFSQPNRLVSSWTTWDLVVSYKLPGDTTISMRGFNAFNKQPPFLNNGVGTVGYDPENADLLGRRISLKVEHAW